MNVHRLVGENENDPVYQALTESNAERYYSFLDSIIETAIAVNQPFLSTAIIKALNYHAIIGLHDTAGEYRPSEVRLKSRPELTFPPPYEVQSRMDDLVNDINHQWERRSAVELAAHALWGINRIHPFVNGNGRTARAVCYFILCIKSGSLLPGETSVPELLKRQENDAYREGLKAADEDNFEPLRRLLDRLLAQQLGVQT